MQSRVHPKYKTKYRVGNWPAYDRALVQRGDITVWLAPDAIATWEAAGVGTRGGQLQYSNLAIETALDGTGHRRWCITSSANDSTLSVRRHQPPQFLEPVLNNDDLRRGEPVVLQFMPTRSSLA
jgi:hypothetical protein